MNCIILEGITLYIFIAIVIVLMLIALGCIFCAILLDKRVVVFEKVLYQQQKQIKKLSKENFVLKIKSGEFDIDET